MAQSQPDPAEQPRRSPRLLEVVILDVACFFVAGNLGFFAVVWWLARGAWWIPTAYFLGVLALVALIGRRHRRLAVHAALASIAGGLWLFVLTASLSDTYVGVPEPFWVRFLCPLAVALPPVAITALGLDARRWTAR